MNTVLHRYPALIRGVLLKRYKRFFADVELVSGEVVTAHCPNTGPMTDISTPGHTVYLSRSENPRRTLAYTWELIETDGVYVGVNTALPNRIIGRGLEEWAFRELGVYSRICREVPYGTEASRIDFWLDGDPPMYLEVKNTTWTQVTPEGRRALFPDTVTTRGQKHLRELTRIAEGGERAAILYFINRSDCNSFSPGDSRDPAYGQLLREAVARGLLVLPYCFEATPFQVNYLGPIPLVL